MGMSDNWLIATECITEADALSTNNRRIAVIGGSGFGTSFLDGDRETITTDYGDAVVIQSSKDGVDVVFLSRHGAGHKIPPHLINHRANIAALCKLGISNVFATAAVGSLRTDMNPGDFVIVDDFVDLTKGEVVTFYDKIGDVRHIDFGNPYDPDLRALLLRGAEAASPGDTRVHPAGTYLCLSGPRYETPAEVRLYRHLGCDIVGMTGAPEAILCREAGLRYASISIVTNYACGLVDTAPLSHEDVEAEMSRSRAFLIDTFNNIIRELAQH